MKPYWALCAVTTVLLLVDVVGALVIPTFAAELLNESATSASFKKMTITAVGMGVAALISGMCAVAGGWCCSQLTSRVGKDVRNTQKTSKNNKNKHMALYRKSMDLSIYDFRNFGTASITTRTINDVVNIQMAMTNVLCMLMPVPIIFIIALTLSFRLDVTLSLWLLVAIAFVCVVALFIMRSAAPLFRKLQKLLDRIGAVLLENLTGVRVIRAFNKESHERRRMDGTFVDYADTSIKANRLFANLDGLSYFGMNAFIVVVYFLAGGRISAGNFQIGDITAIVEYAIMALFYLMMAQMVILTLPRAAACLNRAQQVLEIEPSIVDGKRTLDTCAAEPVDSADAVAVFDHMSFRFDDADEDTLCELNFTCRRGQTTAIVGSTGSGKSTVAKLLLRFHDATKGAIRLDGVDLHDLSQDEIRGRIAYVPQKAWLFSGTVASNLRFGNEGATEADMLHALEVAQSTFVLDQPQGLDTPVAQGGTNFSRCQRQRLAIARALMMHAYQYFFDDSFSALDFKTDAALRHALQNETRDAAVLIIAQRISTILHADQIVVLKDGEVVGLGTHGELMETCEVYRAIAESQMKGGE